MTLTNNLDKMMNAYKDKTSYQTNKEKEEAEKQKETIIKSNIEQSKRL